MQELSNNMRIASLTDPDNGAWGNSDDSVAAASPMLVAADARGTWGGPEVHLPPEGAQGVEASVGLHPHAAALPSIAPRRAT